MVGNRIPATLPMLAFDAMHGRGAMPVRQRWEDHFALRVAVIEPLTAEGKATARLVKVNLDKRVVERQLLAAVGRYPR
jgi:hypothetical protein